MVYKFFDKKSSGSGVAALLANKSATELNYQLANKLHRQITRKIKRRKVYSYFRDNIWGADLGYKIWVDQGGEIYNKLFKACVRYFLSNFYFFTKC